MQKKDKTINDWIREYEILSSKEHNIKIRKSALADKILEYWQDNDVQNHKSEVGTLAMGTRKTWVFSPRVKELEGEIKEQKKHEQENGIAEAKETLYLTYKMVRK